MFQRSSWFQHSSCCWSRLAMAGVFAASLYGCGSDSTTPQTGGAPAATSTLSGTAATGLPITGGNIAINCGNGYTASTTTDSGGQWQIGNVPTASLPCAVQVSFAGQTLHSFTVSTGSAVTVNITPLTNLILAAASEQSPETWFASSNWAAIASQISTAQSDILQMLAGNYGVSLPAGFNPFSNSFTAAALDPYDDFLEALKTAVDDSGSNYADLLTAVAGGGLPDSVLEEDGSTVTYNSITHTRGIFDYQSETGGYSLYGRALSGSWGFLQVRVGNETPASGSLDVAALDPGTGTHGPIANGKVQLYTWGLDGGMAWTDASSSGQVQISVAGDTVTVSGSNITLNNGKTISFQLSADKPSSCSSEAGSNKLLFGLPGLCDFTRTESSLTTGDTLQFRLKESLNKYIDIVVTGTTVTSAGLRNTDGTVYVCGKDDKPACAGIIYSSASGTDQFSFDNALLHGATDSLTANGVITHVRPPTTSTITGQTVSFAASGGADVYAADASVLASDVDGSARAMTMSYGTETLGACALSEANTTADGLLHWGRWNSWYGGCKHTESQYETIFRHYAYGTASPSISTTTLPTADAWQSQYVTIAATTPGRYTPTPADNKASSLPDLSKIKFSLNKQAGSAAVVPDIDFKLAIAGHDVMLEDAPGTQAGIQSGSVAVPKTFSRAVTLRNSNGSSCSSVGVRCDLYTNITFYGPNREYAALGYSLVYMRSDNDTTQAPDVRVSGMVILQKQ